MAGLNGSGRVVREAVSGMADEIAGDVGRSEKVVAGFYIALLKRHEVRHLIIGRTDRRPSAEEAAEIGAAAGAPVGSEPQPGSKWLTAGSLPAKKIATLEFTWREA
jgi:hypothetical protein